MLNNYVALIAQSEHNEQRLFPLFIILMGCEALPVNLHVSCGD